MNYVGAPNPYQLAGPPAWWLQELAIFDSDLVVIPSQQQPVYRLARRVRRGKGLLASHLPQVKDFMPQPDTLQMHALRVVPVTTILPGSVWGTHIFSILRSRDTWRVGGGDKAADLMDEADRQKRQRQRQGWHDDGGAVAADMFKSYSYRAGSRTSMAYSPRSQPATPPVARVSPDSQVSSPLKIVLH
ncbi:MAG TPA: hypothetical protein ENH80_03860 [Phycisphaerae bacterium]|nr:hypothetical protein [Phycisphaerae bacterium]